MLQWFFLLVYAKSKQWEEMSPHSTATRTLLICGEYQTNKGRRSFMFSLREVITVNGAMWLSTPFNFLMGNDCTVQQKWEQADTGLYVFST